jgi:hypothetical protein
MNEEIRTSQRDLIARVATLELLVSDLIDILWRVDPQVMDQLAREANQDVMLQNARVVPGAEKTWHRLLSKGGVRLDRSATV